MPTKNKDKYAAIFNEFKTANPRYMVSDDTKSFLKAYPDIFSEEVRNISPVLRGTASANRQVKLLEKFVEWLDKDFTLVGDNNQPLLTNINLIPLFDEFATSVVNEYPPVIREDVEQKIADIRGAMLDSYARTEMVTMQNTNFKEMTSLSEEERLQAARDRVLSEDVYSSTYRATVVEPGSVSPVTGKAVAAGEFDAGLGSDEIPDTFDEYLRLNPDSSVYDLVNFEQGLSTDDEFTEGFDSSMFAGWVSTKTKNEVNAKKEDGTTAKWSAAQAIKFIYDLSDQNMTGKITELQKMLREAGYFAVLEGSPLPIAGVVDKNMEQAWGLFLTDAARINKTPADMFKEKTRQFAKMAETGEGIVGEDLATVSTNIDALASDILGRRLSPQEKQSLYKAVRGWEREQLSSQLYAPKPTQIDVNARLAQLIEQQNSSEVTFGSIESMTQKFKSWYGE